MARPLAPDQLKTWSRCKKKFYYQSVKKLNWPSDQRNFQLGKDVHKLMDYTSRGLDCNLLLQSATPAVQSCWKQLCEHPISQLPVIASEWAFLVPVGDQWLTGRVDRIAQNGDGLLIIDWKTGTGTPKLPESDWQTLIYLYAVLEARSELAVPNLTAEQLQFVYVEVKPQQATSGIREVRVAYSSEKHQQTQRLIEQTLHDMAVESEFNLPKTCPVRYCPYGAICGIHDPAPIATLSTEPAQGTGDFQSEEATTLLPEL